MTLDDESYFPRGGSGKNENALKRTPYVFQPKQKVVEKKKKLGKRERDKLKVTKVKEVSNSGDETDVSDTVDEPEELPHLKKTQPLQCRDLVEGFVSLCSVQSILTRFIRVSLPERHLAAVKWSDICTPLSQNKMPNKIPDLANLFNVGDVLACRIKSVSGEEGRLEVAATTDPAGLNIDTSCDSLQVGSVFFGAVESVEDHGYMIFSGVSGLNAFLPFENCKFYLKSRKIKKTLPVGKLLWCIVTKADMGEFTNNVQVSIDEREFDRLSPATSRVTTPGSILDLTVTKHLSDRIQVSVVGKDFHGFVPRSHLRTFDEDVHKEYKVGAMLRGIVLYKFPASNVAAFSLKVELAEKPVQIVENGDVLKAAEICWHEPRGIGVKFERRGVTCYGFVSRRRMEGNVESKNLKDRFPKGNHISVVVIGYHHVDKLYTCSTEDDILTGKLLTVKHLKEMVGKAVTVEVKSKTENGAVVTIGNRTAFVPSNQITDATSTKPLKKLKLNSQHQGRILCFDREKNSILVTLRPTLVKNKPLTSFKKVKRGDSYYGIVSGIGKGRITVSFFGNLKTEIPQENLIEDCRKYNVGTLLKCHVIKEKLGHARPEFSLVRSVDQMTLSIGATYTMIVKSKDATGIECILSEGSTVQSVKIPKQYLSDNETLQSKALDRLSSGSTLDAQLFCYDNSLNPVFTLRDSVRRFFAEGGELLRTKGFAALSVKQLIPVIINEVTEEGIYVLVPVPMYNGRVLVDRSAFDIRQKIVVNDLIWTSVNRINPAGKQICLKCPAVETHREQLEHWAVGNLISYFNDMSRFQTYKPGMGVLAILGEEDRCLLADGRQGIIVPVASATSSKIVVGCRSTVTVLFEDWAANEAVYLADAKLSPAPGIEDVRSKEFRVVYVHEMFVICSADSKVCYVPRLMSPFSTKPDINGIAVGDSILVKLSHVENSLLFGCLVSSGSEKNQKEVVLKESENSHLDASRGLKKANKRKKDKNGKIVPNKKLKRLIR